MTNDNHCHLHHRRLCRSQFGLSQKQDAAELNARPQLSRGRAHIRKSSATGRHRNRPTQMSDKHVVQQYGETVLGITHPQPSTRREDHSKRGRHDLQCGESRGRQQVTTLGRNKCTSVAKTSGQPPCIGICTTPTAIMISVRPRPIHPAPPVHHSSRSRCWPVHEDSDVDTNPYIDDDELYVHNHPS